MSSIQLLDVAKFYRGSSEQQEALQWLQSQVSPDVLNQFADKWREKPVISEASHIELSLPYHSQLDNAHSPYGTCNVTSAAMCLAFFGVKPKTAGVQLEDELYEFAIANGLEIETPSGIATIIRNYGFKDDFRADARWQDAKAHLRAGNPLIVHGYFTTSGHIIAIVGFDEEKHAWIVHDPYGEYYQSGYDTSISGKSLTYSYAMMERLCGTDGDLWLHFVSR